jgi:hypothetical protein
MERVMIDPSLLLTASGSAWVSSNVSDLVISGMFMHLLDTQPEQTVARLGVPEHEWNETISRMFRVAPNPYSPRGLASADFQAGIEVVENELAGSGFLGPVFAEEWRFLNTESWLFSGRRWVVDQLHKAGGAVLEHGRRASRNLIRQMIETVIPADSIPPQVDSALAVRTGVKWILVGGATVGLAPVSAPISAATGILGIPFVRAFDP